MLLAHGFVGFEANASRCVGQHGLRAAASSFHCFETSNGGGMPLRGEGTGEASGCCVFAARLAFKNEK